MKKQFYYFLLIFLNIIVSNVNAQSLPTGNAEKHFSLSGALADTINLINTGYASVSFLNASDSILQSYTRTDENGKFSLNLDKEGKYIILVSHPSFAMYVDVIDVSKPNTDIGLL